MLSHPIKSIISLHIPEGEDVSVEVENKVFKKQSLEDCLLQEFKYTSMIAYIG